MPSKQGIAQAAYDAVVQRLDPPHYGWSREFIVYGTEAIVHATDRPRDGILVDGEGPAWYHDGTVEGLGSAIWCWPQRLLDDKGEYITLN